MKRGFTLIELLAVIVILAVIALIATPIILGIINDSKKEAFKDAVYGIIDAAKYNYVETMYSSEAPVDVTFTYEDGVETSSVEGKELNYEGVKPKNGQVLLTKDGKISVHLYDGKWCTTKDFEVTEVTIEEKTLQECMPLLVDISGANAPVLAQGMTAVIWDENVEEWIEASNINNPYQQNWYDYENKKWANAVTNDCTNPEDYSTCSMWVWIPRYVYKITANHHVNTTGTMVVQFSHGIEDDWNGTIDTRTIADASNAATNGDKFTDHPAFWWDNDGDNVRETGEEMTGMWVAKFEASVADQSSLCYTTPNATNCSKTTITPKIIPGANSWRYISIDKMFIVTRNMEIRNEYGWDLASGLSTTTGLFTTDTNKVDTHLMKNSEWGAVAYLSKSQYGKTTEITINNNSSYYTGGGTGTAYITNVGQSTTGTIYGIYDISGGACEYVSAYISNSSADNNWTSIATTVSKYKEIYTVTTDDAPTNYSNTSTKKGDAVWETSNSGTGTKSWFDDWSYMPYTSEPWFMRGGSYNSSSGGGAFFFAGISGYLSSNGGFRPILTVAPGL